MPPEQNSHDAGPPPVDFEAWSRSLIEEVLFRAGLGVADSSRQPDSVAATLGFTVTADGPDKALELAFDRIGGSPLRLRIPLKG